MSQKKGKLLSIIQEFEVKGDKYNINGLDMSTMIVFARTKQYSFEPIPSGNYVIKTEQNIQYLIITNQEYLATIERIQICKEFATISSEYEVDFDVDISILKDRYNEAVQDIKNIYKYIQTNIMIADALDTAVVLPTLNNDEVWVRTQDGYRGFNIGNLEENIKQMLEEIRQLVADGKREINDQTIKSISDIDKKKNESLAQIQGTFDAEVTKGKAEVIQEGIKQKAEVTKQGKIEFDKITSKGNEEVGIITDLADSKIDEITREGTKQKGLVTEQGKIEIDKINATGIDGKLSLTGGTMTGDIVMADGKRFIGAHNFGYMCKDKSGTPDYALYINAYDKLCLGFDNKRGIAFETTDLTCLSGNVWHEGNYTPPVSTIETLKSMKLEVGQVVEILGYYNKEDGATHKRVIANGDDGSGVQLDNGLWANILHNGTVNVEWFGIKYNPTSDVIDESLILFNYYILDKFSKYKYATTYIIGRYGKTISTLGSCQFIKENIEIKINSDIKTTYGYKEHFDKDPNIQSRGHWLAVFGGWIDEPNFVMKPSNMIRIGGVGSIESVYSNKNISLHNHNCIGSVRANNVIVEDIRILGSDHNGIVFDSDTFFLKIQNVQIKNCYDISMNLKSDKHWKPEPNGLSQNKLGGIVIDNCEITPLKSRNQGPLVRCQTHNLTMRNTYLDCRELDTKPYQVGVFLVCENSTFENCVFENFNHVLRPYESNNCGNISVKGCTFKDCAYITLLDFDNAIKNLSIRNCTIKGYMDAPYGITIKAQSQNFNCEFMLNDCSKLSNAFNFNGSNFYRYNKGKKIFKLNDYPYEAQEYANESKSIPIIPNVESKEFNLDDFRNYRYVIIYIVNTKTNTLSFIQIPVVFFFSSSMPLNLHINEECNLSIVETENDKKINIISSNSLYKMSLISYMG